MKFDIEILYNTEGGLCKTTTGIDPITNVNILMANIDRIITHYKYMKYIRGSLYERQASIFYGSSRPYYIVEDSIDFYLIRLLIDGYHDCLVWPVWCESPDYELRDIKIIPV